MLLVKSHGLGNDYLILDRWAPQEPAPWPGRALTAEGARLLCDRHRGVGADGVLEPLASRTATLGLRIWNPDGSVAEKSGNGLRIFARWLVDHRGAPRELSVELPVGLIPCQVEDNRVTVEIGRAIFEPDQIPTREPLRLSPLELGGRLLRLTAVGLGNPHCVVLLEDDLDLLPWRAWGAALEVHPLFPNRTNVQFARVLDAATVEVRVWERGAGETASSGSSAAAVGAVARSLGLVGPSIAVRMPGGTLEVDVRDDLTIQLRGPVEEVARISLSEALAKKLMVTG
jgi:diaminopimelate epimerase